MQHGVALDTKWQSLGLLCVGWDFWMDLGGYGKGRWLGCLGRVVVVMDGKRMGDGNVE